MNEMIETLRERLTTFGPNLLAGLAVLVLGWMVALFASSLVRRLLSRTTLDNKIGAWMGGPDSRKAIPVEAWVGKAVYYLIMVIVLIAFLTTIKLDGITEPLRALLHPFVAYLPNLIGAGLLVLIAWVLARVVKRIITGVLRATKLDDKLGSATQEGEKPMALSHTFAEAAYWLVFLVFLPLLLQTLALQALLEPVTAMFSKVFAFLPNLLSAAAIAVIGWFIARIVQRIVQSLMAGLGVDQLSEKWGMAASFGRQKLSGMIGLVVYFVILVPVLISALAALQLDAITKPASDMLAKIMHVLPNLAGAVVVVLLAVVVGKVISGIVANLLAGSGFNHVLFKLGLAKQAPQGGQTPAAWVGKVVLALIVLLASVTACDMLGLPAVGALIQDFIRFAGRILMGTAIFGLGLLLARIIAQAITAGNSPHAPRLALVIRVVILALAGAMALRQTGLADDIVNLAFGLTFGAAAVAFALAFGLGGRDIAARTLHDLRESTTKEPPDSRA